MQGLLSRRSIGWKK